MTAADLKARTVRDLALMAKRKKVRGWHAMKKDELVRALVRRARAEQQPNRRATATGPFGGPGRRRQIQAKLAETKDLTFRNVSEGAETKDRLVVMVRDPYWLHAYWELSRRSIERARVALGQYLARRPAGAAALRGGPRRHHQRRPAADPRRGHSRRGQQLVHRRPFAAEELSIGHWLPSLGRQVLLLGQEQRGEHARRDGRRDASTAIGPRWQRISSGFSP